MSTILLSEKILHPFEDQLAFGTISRPLARVSVYNIVIVMAAAFSVQLKELAFDHVLFVVVVEAG